MIESLWFVKLHYPQNRKYITYHNTAKEVTIQRKNRWSLAV